MIHEFCFTKKSVVPSKTPFALSLSKCERGFGSHLMGWRTSIDFFRFIVPAILPTGILPATDNTAVLIPTPRR